MPLSGRVLDSFRGQSAGSRQLGSPFTAAICDLLAERLDSSTLFGSRVAGWSGDGFSDALPVRALGGLHALARSGHAPYLTAAYPPHTVNPEELWSAIGAAIEEHDRFLHDYLDSPPQTNEVARSGTIVGACLEITAATRLPLAIYEIGSSAGLNLDFDGYRYELGVGSWGANDSDVRIRCNWSGKAPPLDAPLVVADRAGCDRNPLDPGTPSDCERLFSYIWADQAERLGRTEAALNAARRQPWRVDRADAAEWVQPVLTRDPAQGRARVLMHTIVWQYLPLDTQDRIEAAVLAAGERAETRTPLAWLRVESDGAPDSAGLYLTLWPPGEDVSLGRADFHGRWTHWEKSTSRWRWRTKAAA